MRIQIKSVVSSLILAIAVAGCDLPRQGPETPDTFRVHSARQIIAPKGGSGSFYLDLCLINRTAKPRWFVFPLWMGEDPTKPTARSCVLSGGPPTPPQALWCAFYPEHAPGSGAIAILLPGKASVTIKDWNQMHGDEEPDSFELNVFEAEEVLAGGKTIEAIMERPVDCKPGTYSLMIESSDPPGMFEAMSILLVRRKLAADDEPPVAVELRNVMATHKVRLKRVKRVDREIEFSIEHLSQKSTGPSSPPPTH